MGWVYVKLKQKQLLGLDEERQLLVGWVVVFLHLVGQSLGL